MKKFNTEKCLSSSGHFQQIFTTMLEILYRGNSANIAKSKIYCIFFDSKLGSQDGNPTIKRKSSAKFIKESHDL